jgi:quinoprotein relay system zinc metallohydrolase 2
MMNDAVQQNNLTRNERRRARGGRGTFGAGPFSCGSRRGILIAIGGRFSLCRPIVKDRRVRRKTAMFAAAVWVFSTVGLVGSVPLSAQPGVFAVQQIADGDYAHFGEVAMTTIDNAGDIANIGIVVGRDAVAIIDTGGSVAVGQELRAAIRRLTDKPLRYVINTHEHPDHIFGNAVFADAGVTFAGHRNLPASIRAHGPFYLHSFRDALGNDAIAQVRLIPPTLLVDTTMTLDLGGRTLLLTAWYPPAHTDCDLTVVDEQTHTLFAGDLVFLDHVPVIDGSLKGWLDVLPRLAATPAERVLPGHGRQVAPWPAALDDERRYLLRVQADARRLIASGIPLAQAVPLIGQSERERWQLFDDYNPRNATAAFSELEWE